MSIPVLETERLLVRPFVTADLEEVHRILDKEAFPGEATLDERRTWLEWTIRNYEALARLYQPPYGDRGIVLKESNQLIGSVGLVPCIVAFGQLAYYQNLYHASDDGSMYPEFGLYWGLDNAHRGQGYATEAAQAVVDFAFTHLHLKRVIATTDYTNEASIRVMQRLGMELYKNLRPEVHPYMQVVGILEKK